MKSCFLFNVKFLMRIILMERNTPKYKQWLFLRTRIMNALNSQLQTSIFKFKYVLVDSIL